MTPINAYLTKDCTAEPIPDENSQIYVTADSARKAAYEVVRRHTQPWHDELVLQREEVYNEILDTYLKAALPSNEEQKTLRLTRNLQVCHNKESKNPHYFDIYDLHKEIKPVNEPVEISLTHILALNALQSRFTELKAQEERMTDRLFEEIMYMREKRWIEPELPELVPLLEFRPFCYDTYFWKDILSEKK